MRRLLCDHPTLVSLHDDHPVFFEHAGRGFEVTALLKMVALIRPVDDVDNRLYQVRARTLDGPETTYELECDHGHWRVVACWRQD